MSGTLFEHAAIEPAQGAVSKSRKARVALHGGAVSNPPTPKPVFHVMG